MTVDTELDRIERDITINAPIDRVWELISRPGWWVNNGTAVDNQRNPDQPGRVIVHHPDCGTFAVATVALDEPRYAAYRWYPGPSDERRAGELGPGASTLVEFFLHQAEGQVTVRVVESGFATLDEDARVRRETFDSNASGWDEELGLAKAYVEDATP